jgi:hypothetical protein
MARGGDRALEIAAFRAPGQENQDGIGRLS